MSNRIDIHVRARAERRCRCGMCFDTAGKLVSVTKVELERLKADPLLVITEADSPEEAEAPTASEAEAPKDEAPATAKTDKTAAKAAKKAG